MSVEKLLQHLKKKKFNKPTTQFKTISKTFDQVASEDMQKHATSFREVQVAITARSLHTPRQAAESTDNATWGQRRRPGSGRGRRTVERPGNVRNRRPKVNALNRAAPNPSRGCVYP